MRIAFFGLPLAGCLLHHDGHQIVLAVLPPVEGPGRRRLRRLLGPSVPLVDWLARPEGSIPSPEADEALIDELLAQTQPDWIVSWFWTRRFTAEQLARARLGALGAHPSLLPRHRGPNPYFAAIDAGDRETGVTIHRLTEAYDEGAILAQESIPVGASNSWQLARRLDRPSVRQLRHVVRAVTQGVVLPEVEQDPTAATWAPEPTGDLLRVDWRWPTERVLRRLRALAPVPGLALEFAGLSFFALEADSAPEYPAALLPSEGAVVGEPPALVIRTGDGAIRILSAQLADEDSAGLETEEAGHIVSGQGLARWVAIP